MTESADASHLPDPRLAPIVNEHELAAEGIALVVDCRFDEAAALFDPWRDSHPSMALSYCLNLVMRAIASFEDEDRSQATEALKIVQHDSHNERGRYRKVLQECLRAKESGESLESHSGQNGTLFHTIAKYHIDLVLADCYLCSAIITMMNLDWTSYAKSGWIVRKSWKLYEKLYREAKKMNEVAAPGLRKASSKKSLSTNSLGDAQNGQSSSNATTWTRPEMKAVCDLYSAVCFGYGLFNLLLSILSPQVLKLMSFLGFIGNRRTGLDCLTYASRCDGMRSALATLSLLWFHTVARPFFALDGAVIDAGIDDAQNLLSSAYSRRLTTTMLFVFFQGRIKRLQSDITGAIDHYFKALCAAGGQKELRQMCQYELAWCYLHVKQWIMALPYFNELKETSKWAPSYYSYMVALCYGCSGESDTSMGYFREAVKNVKHKKSPLEAFVLRRAKKIMKNAQSTAKDHYFLYMLEVMYIWRALLNVPLQVAEEMIQECRNFDDLRSMLPLKCLLEGILCARLGRPLEETEQCFRECIARSDGRERKDEKHWVAFATYELGYLLMKKKETRQEARDLLLTAKDKFHGCDFDNRLSMRVYAALKWIERYEADEGGDGR